MRLAVRHAIITSALCAALLSLAAGGTAFAAEPAVTSTESPAFGRSAFTYSDLSDTALKYEGGYAAFANTSTLTYSNPHGGYDTTTNKCSVCHAVHRSQGSYYLLRGESQADACVYCHIGSAHSQTIVYGNPGGLSTGNGHGMGAGPNIPVSAVSVSMETTSVVTTDASGTITTASVTVRTVGAPNRIFRLSRRHTQEPAGSLQFGYLRVGPNTLSCLSCHQPHNAPDELWRPTAYPSDSLSVAAGYMLLRARPSGSIWGPDGMPYGNGGPATVSYSRDGMRGYQQYKDFSTTGLVNAGNALKALESTITSATTGTGRTTFPATDFSSTDGTAVNSPATATGSVNQYALAVWCADCHNLALGDFRSNRQGTTTSTVFPSSPTSASNTSVSTTSTTFVQLKQLTMDLTGVVALHIRTDARVEVSGTVDLGVDVAGQSSVSHSTSATSFATFDDTMPVTAGGPGTAVTLSLRSSGGTVSNQTLELYAAVQQTSTSLLFADLSQPAHETSRTHTAPMAAAVNGAGQCFTCHRSGLTPAPSSAGYDAAAAKCERCHYGTGSFAVDPLRTAGASSDWPHSGETSAAYLLGAWTFDASGSVVPAAVTTDPATIRSVVCMRCHVPGSRTHTSTPSP